MPQDKCGEYQSEVEAALAELKAIQAGGSAVPAASGANTSTPMQGSDVGSHYYESVGRLEAAKGQYRTAVRSLSECRGSHPA